MGTRPRGKKGADGAGELCFLWAFEQKGPRIQIRGPLGGVSLMILSWGFLFISIFHGILNGGEEGRGGRRGGSRGNGNGKGGGRGGVLHMSFSIT